MGLIAYWIAAPVTWNADFKCFQGLVEEASLNLKPSRPRTTCLAWIVRV